MRPKCIGSRLRPMKIPTTRMSTPCRTARTADDRTCPTAICHLAMGATRISFMKPEEMSSRMLMELFSADWNTNMMTMPEIR